MDHSISQVFSRELEDSSRGSDRVGRIDIHKLRAVTAELTGYTARERRTRRVVAGLTIALAASASWAICAEYRNQQLNSAIRELQSAAVMREIQQQDQRFTYFESQ